MYVLVLLQIIRCGVVVGKPALTLYKLRHSFATNFHKKNNDLPPKLKDQLGHTDLNPSLIYTHIGALISVNP
jgi:site-specific recombinase XerD